MGSIRRSEAVQHAIVLFLVDDPLEEELCEEVRVSELVKATVGCLRTAQRTFRILKKAWPVSKLSLPAVCC